MQVLAYRSTVLNYKSDSHLVWGVILDQANNTFTAEPYDLKFDYRSTALVVIDMQRDFLLNFCEKNPEKEFIDGVLLLYEMFPETY